MSKHSREPRCIHRHTVKTHPNCFVVGRVEPPYVDDADFERRSGKPWWEFRKENGDPFYRIGFFDIEVDNLKADFGTVLSWAIKPLGEDPVYSVIKKKELFDIKYDRRVVEDFIKELDNFDILVGYFSSRFDMPYMRAKALHYGMKFPGFALQQNRTGKFYSKGTLIHWDLFYTVRSKLGISRKSLENACDYLGIEAKGTPLSRDTWRAAKYGDPKAVEEVLQHNLEDVESTEALWMALQPYKKWTRTSA